MKLKVSHSIDQELLDWLDAQIARKRFASRSHGIQYAIQHLKEADKT